MIHLFPKRKNRMYLICGCYIALLGVYFALNKGINPVPALLLGAAGLGVVIFSQHLTAFNMHSQLLAKLYDHLNVDGFLKTYEPMLKIPVKNQNIALTLRLHASNAYCAQGRFDEAIALLTSFQIQPGKNKEEDLLSRFAVVSNLCYCAEQKNDIETAKTYMNELRTLKKELEAMQEGKPMKKRMVFNTELNEQCLNFLTTGKADVEVLRNLVKNNPQQLHKITLSLWVARAELALNNRREAEKLLEQIVKLAPDLYPGKVAAQLLTGLPAKTESKE